MYVSCYLTRLQNLYLRADVDSSVRHAYDLMLSPIRQPPLSGFSDMAALLASVSVLLLSLTLVIAVRAAVGGSVRNALLLASNPGTHVDVLFGMGRVEVLDGARDLGRLPFRVATKPVLFAYFLMLALGLIWFQWLPYGLLLFASLLAWQARKQGWMLSRIDPA